MLFVRSSSVPRTSKNTRPLIVSGDKDGNPPVVWTDRRSHPEPLILFGSRILYLLEDPVWVL